MIELSCFLWGPSKDVMQICTSSFCFFFFFLVFLDSFALILIDFFSGMSLNQVKSNRRLRGVEDEKDCGDPQREGGTMSN